MIRFIKNIFSSKPDAVVNVSSEEREEFCRKLEAYSKPTKEMVLTKGDPGSIPKTKISGTPWWPKEKARPQCKHGHPMSFIMQIALSDIPGMTDKTESLYSFHYCDECTLDGNMSFGFFDKGTGGYDISVFKNTNTTDTDDLGMVADSIVEPYDVEFCEKQEVPSYPEICDILETQPEDFPQGEDDFDENIYPGLIHVAKAKLGGWPAWVQNVEWPDDMQFISQLDWMLCPDAPWCTGYAYLFMNADEVGELVIQTT